MNFKSKKYYKSPQWRYKSHIKKLWQPYCERCSSVKNLEVHHTTYKNFGHEEVGDLQVLCKKCHQRVHNKVGVSND